MIATTTIPAPAANAHQIAGPPVVGDVDSFPSHAELSRTLIEPGGIATLSTLTPSGYPYASIAPYSALTNGAPLICVSSLAEHTQNLRLDPRSSVLVKAPSNPGVDPLSQARVTVLGAFIPAEPSNAEIEAHLELHPFARHYVGFADFSWWRLDASELRYVGGFGAMGWATGQAYSEAVPDPVLPYAAPMIEHLNADHAEACLSIVRHLTGVPEALRAPVSSIDRYGMTIDAYGAGDDYLATARAAFLAPLASADEVRGASVALVRKASAAKPG